VPDFSRKICPGNLLRKSKIPICHRLSQKSGQQPNTASADEAEALLGRSILVAIGYPSTLYQRIPFDPICHSDSSGVRRSTVSQLLAPLYRQARKTAKSEKTAKSAKDAKQRVCWMTTAFCIFLGVRGALGGSI